MLLLTVKKYEHTSQLPPVVGSDNSVNACSNSTPCAYSNGLAWCLLRLTGGDFEIQRIALGVVPIIIIFKAPIETDNICSLCRLCRLLVDIVFHVLASIWSHILFAGGRRQGLIVF